MSKHLENELLVLKNKVLSVLIKIDDVVTKAIKALETIDRDLALEVIKIDTQIDTMEVEIEEECLKALALYQPVAVDLRYVVGILKANNDLERIGDLAVNIAECVLYISKLPLIKNPFNVKDMANKTLKMLNKGINALINLDVDGARTVWKEEEEIDKLNLDMYKIFYATVKERPEEVEALTSYFSAVRHLERIADYVTNIAEDIIYIQNGEIVRHSPELHQIRENIKPD